MSLIKMGSSGEEVTLLQKALSELTGTRLSYDGSFGLLTKKALVDFQEGKGIAPTGVYDEATQEFLVPFIDEKYIRLDEIDNYADILGVDKNVLKSIAIKEAKASGFTPSGKCLILYERHIFHRYATAKFGKGKVSEWSKKNPNICFPTRDPKAYMGGEREWTRLDQAKNWDAETALISCSWGMFQIMGFNFGLAGYKHVGVFVSDMCKSEKKHLEALTNLIKNSDPLYRAIKSKNFPLIARYYNGPNYSANNYDKDLIKIYNSLVKKGN